MEINDSQQFNVDLNAFKGPLYDLLVLAKSRRNLNLCQYRTDLLKLLVKIPALSAHFSYSFVKFRFNFSQ